MAYANAVKEDLLDVRAATLEMEGAVSEPTAIQMAQGVCRLLGADYALAVTGIAGPTGATPGKPVGLVYIALVGPDVERCERHVWDGDRLTNKEASARRALQMLIEHLQGIIQESGAEGTLHTEPGSLGDESRDKGQEAE